MKKLVCILLTLVMVMSLSITAFAESGNGNVGSLTENNTQDITITNTISTGEGGITSKNYHVKIDWVVSSTGAITIDRSAEYEWNPTSLKYVLKSEDTYALNSDNNGTTNEIAITVTNYSNADIGYEITWTTDAQCAQYNGVTETKADPYGVCQANKAIERADDEYRQNFGVGALYQINPNVEGFDDFEGEAHSDTYSGTVTFQPQANLGQLYSKSTITLGKYTVTIGNPPSAGDK